MPRRVRRPYRSGSALALAGLLAGLVVPSAVVAAPPGGVVERLAPVVGPGDSGDDVTAWQERLNEWLRLTGSSLFPIVVDGDFGPQTETATREFQRANAAVGNDGSVEADDLVALEAAISTLESAGVGDTAADETADEAADDGFDETLTWWQTALNDWLALTDNSLFPIVVDGIYGPQTETATRTFQRADDTVDNDGTVDDDDRVAIENAIAALEATGTTPATTDDGAAADDTADDDTTDEAADDGFDETLTWWQTALNDWLALTDNSLFPIVVDGIYGPQTETATRTFQRADDTVDNDGTVDDDDRVAIENAIAALEATGTTPATADDTTDDDSTDEAAAAAAESFDVVVSWWQARLNEWLRLMSSGLYPIEVDGIFGPQTETATREFQRDDDAVDNDGVVDPIDRVALENAIESLGDGAATGADTSSDTTDDGSTDVTDEVEVDPVDQRVIWWQAGLNEWLFLTDHVLYPIVVDGEFGPQTATATRVFEASTDGLSVDGLVTDADRVALESAISELGG